MLKLASLTASGLILATSLSIAPASAAQFGIAKPALSTDSSVMQAGWRCGPRRHWSYRFGRCIWN